MSASHGGEAGGWGESGGVGFRGSVRSGATRCQNLNGSDANSECEPSAKKQRTVFLDGPPEEEETAEKKLADAGFDPGNYWKVHDFGEDFNHGTHERYCTPLIHFCRQGDIKMCRYLLQKGASVHETSQYVGFENWLSPMYAASVNENWREENRDVNFDICKLLFKNGAPINPCNKSDLTPLLFWANDINKKCIEECKWFIRNGALTGDDGIISEDALRRDIQWKYNMRWDIRTDLLSWAENALKTHCAFQLFLLGSAFPSRSSSQNLPPHLTRLSGKAGILEHIGNFVGVARGRDLRMFRQLAPLLAQYILEKPHETFRITF